MKKSTLIFIFFLSITIQSNAQFLMDMIDTSKSMGKNMLGLYDKFNKIQISGYIQPQFNMAEVNGLKNYNGGDLSLESNNRFMIRRGRLRFDYVSFTKENKPELQFVFQFDGSERGVFIRDFWGRYFDTKYDLFIATAGMFARPFGYEVNLSSADRESPERGRMSQILMKVERDLGAMISFEPRKKNHPLRYFKWDIGLFNGQGLTAPTDYDSHKDLISRISLKPYPLSNNINVSMGISYLNGGWLQKNPTRYTLQKINATQYDFVKLDENFSNTIAPRKYYGADFQLKHKTKAGFEELRAEYWWGTQAATIDNTETPAVLLTEPVYIRKFAGGFLYFLKNIGNVKNQLGIKYDWYDPNTLIKGTEIGNGNALTPANIMFTTVGVGYIHHFTENLKSVLWYDIIKNENTSLAGYQKDVPDNMFTLRLQFRF